MHVIYLLSPPIKDCPLKLREYDNETPRKSSSLPAILRDTLLVALKFIAEVIATLTSPGGIRLGIDLPQ